SISIILRHHDFVTAHSVAAVVREAFSDISVQSRDASVIEVEIPKERSDDPVGFIAELESLMVTPDASGKVVIDSESGIIIFGEQVRIGSVAVSYKAVQVNVGAYQRPSDMETKEQFTLPETTTVEELVSTLQAVGLKTETIINLLKAIDRAGSLYGELIIM
ncbi:hypothetical protein LCGC14_2531780, partial [marine sediment metagenome]